MTRLKLYYLLLYSIIVHYYSMEEVLASNPEILKELKTELIHLLDRRLQGLGIDPEWSGVPKKTFKTKLAVLKHHQKITAKVS